MMVKAVLRCVHVLSLVNFAFTECFHVSDVRPCHFFSTFYGITVGRKKVRVSMIENIHTCMYACAHVHASMPKTNILPLINNPYVYIHVTYDKL